MKIFPSEIPENLYCHIFRGNIELNCVRSVSGGAVVHSNNGSGPN